MRHALIDFFIKVYKAFRGYLHIAARAFYIYSNTAAEHSGAARVRAAAATSLLLSHDIMIDLWDAILRRPSSVATTMPTPRKYNGMLLRHHTVASAGGFHECRSCSGFPLRWIC